MPRLPYLPPLLAALVVTTPLFAADVPVAASAIQLGGRALATDKGWQATWPGVNWTLRFTGSAVGVQLNDAKNYYVLEIDGKPALQITPASGERTLWVRGLKDGEHTAQLIKRSESPKDVGLVGGFVLDGGKPLPPAPRPARRIEFIGDSYTAALGNLSGKRECSEEQVWLNTDVTQGFAVQTARALNADWQTTAMSGMGVLRNWNGNSPQEDFRSYYPLTLHTEPASRYDFAWKPQLVVIGLGTNDFSTPVRAGEARNQEQLARDWLAAYRELLAQTRARYGKPHIIVTGAYLWPDDRLRPLLHKLVSEEQQAGHKIAFLDWGSLELTGCSWHPSLADHRKMATLLQAKITELGDIWRP
ncbi:SGNH/GDSL hydrolase family protein [Chitinilyticum litopenaei]|uniref:SGNH/GDSL hydrolase family protein n=1 Tax=Chitinilyticum litopenaei TaxID=1121276 RepID=UPI00068505B6|nr:SGNH/GDSL hydrolase family protein [Chitinilyticum litopenaei]